MHVAIYQTDERLLFTEIRGGNTEAFAYAFRKYAPRLEAFARKYTADTTEAEDIVQEAFLKLWERRELLESVSLASFLFHAGAKQLPELSETSTGGGDGGAAFAGQGDGRTIVRDRL